MNGLALKTQLPASFSLDDVRYVLDGAIRRETDLAKARRAHFEHTCRDFERQYHMSSEDFMRQFDAGALGDDVAYFDWYAAKRGLDVWERKLLILFSRSSP